jgi:hypothetical protein
VRFDLRLIGRTAAGRTCVLETSVYAATGQQLEQETAKAAELGPWYYQDCAEVVAEGELITVEGVEQLQERRPDKDAGS